MLRASGSECAIFFFFFFCFVPPLQLSLDADATHEVDAHVRHFFFCFQLAGHQRPASVNHEATHKKKKNDEEKNLPPASA